MSATQPSREYLSVSAAAARLDVHARTIRRWIAAGKLSAYRIGGTAVRIKVADLEHLGRRIPTASAA
jgi:excisionase family DNA binding protein